MIILFITGVTILIVAIVILCKLLKRGKTPSHIDVPHKTLPNGIIEVELQDLSVLWLDQPKQKAIHIPKDKPVVPVEQPKQESNNEIAEWYESDDFVQFLRDCINEHINLCSGTNFSAFSFNGIVYLTPFSLWSYITLYTKAKGIEQKEKQKQQTMLAVVGSLTKRGFVKIDDMKEGKYTAVYLIIAHKKDTKLKPKGVYIPLIAEYFNTENKKEGILTFISNVELHKEASDAE